MSTGQLKDVAELMQEELRALRQNVEAQNELAHEQTTAIQEQTQAIMKLTQSNSQQTEVLSDIRKAFDGTIEDVLAIKIGATPPSFMRIADVVRIIKFLTTAYLIVLFGLVGGQNADKIADGVVTIIKLFK